MHRIMRSNKQLLFFVALTTLSFIVRTSASLGQPIARFPDSVGYEQFALWGTVDRFWPISLVYSLLPADAARVVFHVVVGVAAWTWLAYVVARISRWPKSAFTLIIFLGLSPQVIRYDITILSESLGISFAVCAFAATLHRRISQTSLTLSMWITSIALCAMTRPTHLVVLLFAFLPTIVTWMKTRTIGNAIVVGAMAVLSVFSFVQLHGNSSTSMLNFYTVLAERVITDDDRYEWFVSHGMPDVAGMRNAFGYDYSSQLPPDVAAIVQLPTGQNPPTLMRIGGTSLATWVDAHGWSTYVEYLITHPSDTVARLTSLLDETLSPPNTEFLPLENGPMLPSVFLLSWQLWSLLFIGGLCAHFAIQHTRQLAYLFTSVAIIVILVYCATSLTSGIEHPRHMVTVAVMLRVCALVAILTLATHRISTSRDDARAFARHSISASESTHQ